MSEDEVRREAMKIAGAALVHLDHEWIWDALPDDISDEDAEEIFSDIRSIGDELIESGDDPSEWEDEDGEPITLTPKGFLALMLEDMVPGLETEVAMELVTDLIERAVDRAEIPSFVVDNPEDDR